MKPYLLLATLMLVSCGKKAEESGPKTTEAMQQAQTERTNNQQLLSAVTSNDARSVAALLRKGANPDLQTPDGNTLLTFAINQNFPSIVEALLVGGASTEKVDTSNNIPLLLSVKNRSPLLARLLIVHGADIDVRNNRGRTALILAILDGDAGLAEWLIDRGANIELEDTRGKDALYYAMEQGLDNLASKITVRIEINKGLTSEALLTKLLIAGSDVLAIREVLSKSAGILNLVPDAMNLAAAANDEAKALELVQLLLDYEVSVQGGGPAATPLMAAAAKGHQNVVKLLLDNGADIRRTTDSGKSALVYAIEAYQLDVVKYLLGKNAPKKYETAGVEGETIKHEACQYARDSKKNAIDDVKKDVAEKIMQELGCGLRWLIFW